MENGMYGAEYVDTRTIEELIDGLRCNDESPDDIVNRVFQNITMEQHNWLNKNVPTWQRFVYVVEDAYSLWKGRATYEEVEDMCQDYGCMDEVDLDVDDDRDYAEALIYRKKEEEIEEMVYDVIDELKEILNERIRRKWGRQ